MPIVVAEERLNERKVLEILKQSNGGHMGRNTSCNYMSKRYSYLPPSNPAH